MNYLQPLFKISGSRASKRQTMMTWSVTVNESEGSFSVHYGAAGGKITTKTTICQPKNIGRINETSAAKQAHIEAAAKWDHQVNRKLYKADIDDGIPPIYTKPMLALDLSKHAKRINWNKRQYVTQPKLNGVRVIASRDNDTIKLQSREGMSYSIKHIETALLDIMPGGLTIDGELFLGNGYDLGDVTSALKPGTARHSKLELHVFDIVDAEDRQDYRLDMLDSFFSDVVSYSAFAGFSIKMVESKACDSMAELDAEHDRLVAQGYEGVMLRDLAGVYDFGEKNIFVGKYKKFKDEEFKIVDVIADKDGCAIMVLKTDNRAMGGDISGNVTVATFNCRCMGSNAARKAQLASKWALIGLPLTVRFSQRLKSGAPEFCRGVAVRDYESNAA